MTRYSLLLAFILFISLLFIASSVQAADAVIGTGTPASCTEADFNTKLATVLASGSGTITFNCGGPATINFTAGKVITGGAFTIDGGGQITLSGVNAVRHFYVEASAELTLKNITLTNGFDNTYGGGSTLSLGALTLNNTTIQNSNVDPGHSGGAIMSLDAPVTIIDSLIENNTGGSAGGLYLFGENADATITGSTFRNNRTTNVDYGYGGAITPWDGADVTIQNSTLTQNQARYGGAIYNDHTNTTITIEQNSILSENVSEEDGGGLFNANGQVMMTDVSITGNSAGNQGGGVHNNSSEKVELTHVIVSNNTATGDGGGIWDDRQSSINNQVWTNMTIQNNTSGFYGGGIYAQNASLIIDTTAISGNTSNRGGGIYFSQGNLTISDLTIHNNQVVEDSGGGIYITNGTMNIFDSTISDNSANERGGGITIYSSTLYAYRSTISGNSAQNGGGVDLFFSTTNMTNVTISQNSAAKKGGGLNFFSFDSQTDLKYVTFFNNTAGVSGNNIYALNEGTLTLKNIILHSDLGNNCVLDNGATITSSGFNIASDDSCNLTGTADQQNIDAQLGPLQDNGGPTLTHLPRLDGPAIDAGQCVTGVTADQRGLPRLQGTACDIGAVERQPSDTDGYLIFLPSVVR